MRRVILFLCLGGAGLATPPLGAENHALEEISVGYFRQWPTPAQFSQHKQTYDSALELRVNWVPFDSGGDLNAALASGAVQIGYAHGHVSFLAGVSEGLDLTLVGIAVSYPESDLCIVPNGSDITQASARLLEGRKVATVLGGVTHYRLLRVLEHLQVDAARVDIRGVDSAASAIEALRRGEVAMACASGNALREAADLGEPLMTGAEQEALGLRLFDVISVSTDFMQRHPEIVQAFMDVTEATNAQWKKNPAPMRPAIARAAGMDPDSVAETIDRFSFPTAHEQKSARWLGALVPAYSKALADFFVEQGRLRAALQSYERFVTTRFLR